MSQMHRTSAPQRRITGLLLPLSLLPLLPSIVCRHVHIVCTELNEKRGQLHTQRLRAETSIPSTMCERAPILNHTDQLCVRTPDTTCTPFLTVREREKERETDEMKRKSENANALRTDIQIDVCLVAVR